MGSNPLQPPGQPGPLQPGEFQGASKPNLVGFKIRDIDPPSSLYIQRDDVLFIQAASSAGGNSVTATVRLWLAQEGRITTIQQVLQLPTAYTVGSMSVTLAEGYLLSVTLSNAPSAVGAHNYGMAVLNRGKATLPLPSPGATLFAGPIIGTVPVGWPGGGITPPLSGSGVRVVQTVANPGAGNDWTFGPTGDARAFEVEHFNAQLVTSAVAGNRTVVFIVDDGTTPNFESPPTAVIPASTTSQVSGAQTNVSSVVSTTNVSVTIPPRNLLTNIDRVRVATAGKDVGDVWSNIRLVTREWIYF